VTRRRIDGPLWVLMGAIGVILITRLAILLSNLGRFDGDEGVTGVMAQRILDGDLPIYFGIQSYQGALEQYLQAGVLALLPDTYFTLRLVQLALVVLICVLVYVLGTKAIGSRWGGALAAVLYAVGPYYSAWKGVRSHGGYDGAIIFGLLVILLALHLRKDAARAPWVASLIGLCAGLAIWENYLCAYLLIPGALWAVGSARGSLRRLVPPAAMGFVVGILPIIIFRLRNGLNPPSGTGTPPATGFTDRVGLLLSPVTGQFLGPGSAPAEVNRWFPAALIVMIALGVLGAAVWTRRWGIWDLLTLRTARRRPIDIVLVGFLVTPILYGLSSYTWFAGEPRYLFTLYPFLAVGTAAAVFALRRRARVIVGSIVVALSALLLGWTMTTLQASGGFLPVVAEGPVLSENLPQVADALEERGVTAVYADYWVSYPLQFAGGNRFSVTPYANSHFPAIDARTAADASPGIVAVTAAGAKVVRDDLKAKGRTFREADVAGYTIFWDVTPPRRGAGG
jgi:hypothetical protein